MMEAHPKQILALRAILNTFVDSTGVKVNFDKTNMLPTNISTNRLQHPAKTFGCQTSSMLFTYLGLPLGTTKPRLEEFEGMVSKVERRMIRTSIFLTQTKKLEMVKSVLSSMVIIVHIENWDVTRVLVDNGSQEEIIFLSTS
jgi:hypothetical protein